MQHPFIRNKRELFLYIGMWAVISTVLFFILTEGRNVSAYDSLFHSFVAYAIFWLLGYFLWYPVKYYKPTKSVVSNLFFAHLMIASVCVMIWYSLNNFIFSIASVSLPVMSVEIIAIIFFYSILVLIFYLTIYYVDLETKMKEESFLKDTLRTTELNLLKSQINPHFLFNSLNSISALTFISPEKAQKMIISLSDYLRYSIAFPNQERVSLKVELENIERFLSIEKIRFGDRLAYNMECDQDAYGHLIPPMLLQPLVENAIKHGVYQSTELVTIEINVLTKEDHLEITIVNNFDEAMVNKNGTGLGLVNCKERLRILYGSSQFLETHADAGKYFVRVQIPFDLKNNI
jgi:two-component system LytT family sensor kinase